jgi:hypothetical protein
MSETRLREEFKVHALNELGRERAADIAMRFSACLNHLESIIGTGGRAMALVRTKLQEAQMFAMMEMAGCAWNQEGYVEPVRLLNEPSQ